MVQLNEIKGQELLDNVAKLHWEGCRLVQIMCSMVEAGYELTYNFDKEGQLVNLRVIVPQGGALPSITSKYLYAFIWENEIHDLFGLEFQNIVPDFDYHGKFFRLAEPTPWNPQAQVAMPKGLGIDASIKVGGGSHA